MAERNQYNSVRNLTVQRIQLDLAPANKLVVEFPGKLSVEIHEAEGRHGYQGYYAWVKDRKGRVRAEGGPGGLEPKPTLRLSDESPPNADREADPLRIKLDLDLSTHLQVDVPGKVRVTVEVEKESGAYDVCVEELDHQGAVGIILAWVDVPKAKACRT